MKTSELNELPEERAAPLLLACCGSSRWVAGMLRRRPFASADALLAAADEVWASLSESDWREAFSHHPRLGERTASVKQGARAEAWSGGEQSGLADASELVRAALADANAAYEARFGFICIICATGKRAPELLQTTRARLGNSVHDELRVAAEEQRKITRLRLLKLLDPSTRPD